MYKNHRVPQIGKTTILLEVWGAPGYMPILFHILREKSKHPPTSQTQICPWIPGIPAVPVEQTHVSPWG